ncbi:MAG: DUF2470 domain-containing protein [Pseudomonadota bacterium]
MSDTKQAVRQPVDDDARRTAKDMIRTARFGALALCEPEASAPTVGRVGLATDCDGSPVFLVSTLSGRVACMTADPRAAVLIGEPGAGDPLAHRRLTLHGTVERCENEQRARVQRRYLARHPGAARYADFDDFSFWRLRPAQADLVLGFGRAFALTHEDLATPFPDWSAWHAMERGAVTHMNEDHLDATALYAHVLCGAPNGEWHMTGLDPEGVDMALGDDHRRLTYDASLSSCEALRPELVRLVREARRRADGAPESSRDL